MDQQWLDSLSEDWISQPRSSPPASLPTSTPSNASTVSQKSQSRIPRYNRRRSSISVDRGSVSSLPTASRQAVQKDSRALHERSFSELNIPCEPAASKNSREQDSKISPSRGRKLSRTVSASTAHSVEHNTVQYKSVSCSPDKSRHGYETPDWKRRIIRGQVAYGEQRDLFGPSGLESIFQPPAPQQEQQKQGKKRGVQKFIAQEEIPSSPPPYLSVTQQTKECTTHLQTTQTVGTTRLEVLNEEEEGDGDNTSNNGSEVVRQPMDQTPGSAQDDLGPELDRGSSFDPIATSTSCPVDGCGRTSRVDMRPNGALEDDGPPSLVAHRIDSNGKPSKTRTASGLEEERNEGISPIFVSRQNTIDGSIDYAALNQSMDKMRDDLRKLHLQNDKGIDSETKEPPPSGKPTKTRSASPSVLVLEEWASQSLPGNLTTGTQDFISHGGFVNVRRGGYSSEGSFQRRNLSPSSMPSPLRSDETDGTSVYGDRPRRGSWPCISEDETHMPPAPTPPSLFKTPTKSQAHRNSTPEKSRSSGSPLKLFGTYDTFTNERLLRRLSQFEDSYPHEEDELEHPFDNDLEYDSVCQKTSASEAVVVASQSHTARKGGPDHSWQGRRLSSFGDGQLNDYAFEELSYAPGCSSDLEGSLERLASLFPQSPTHKNRNRTKKCKARKISCTSSTIKKQKAVEVPKDDTHNIPKHSSIETEGKRPLTSPIKDPTPKRRRTLHRSEIGVETNICGLSVKAVHHEIQKVIGMKRKDARRGTSQSAASPAMIASRRILCPRTPISSQPRNSNTDEGGEEIVNSGHASPKEPGGGERPSKLRTEIVDPEVETPAEAVAEELAAFGVDVGEHLLRGNRKGSVTTQDFLDEAVKIMDIIRAKGRPQSGLASVEESESDDHKSEDGYEGAIIDDSDSTKESFTRPPSREGLSVSKPRRQAQQDPRVVSHLRKFEEQDETDDILLSSIKSLQISYQTQPTKIAVAAETEDYESQPPNIRIHQKRKHTDISSTDHSAQIPDIQILSQSSQSSSYPSSGRTIPTGSSTSSNTKHIIAPDKVSHLIPGQVAGMTYDATKKAWIKQKDPTTALGGSGVKSLSEESEQDPFGDIPDLTVDDMEDLRRMSDILAKQSKQDENIKTIEGKDMASQNTEDGPEQDVGKDFPTLQRSIEQHIDEAPAESSSTVSRTSVMRSSGPKTETRATSCGEEDLLSKEHKDLHIERTSRSNHSEEQAVEIEHEFGIHEGRHSATPFRSMSRTRNVTIAFSSPVVSHVQYDNVEYSESAEFWSDRSELEIGGSMLERQIDVQQPDISQPSRTRRTSTVFAPCSTHRGASRGFSLGGRGFTPEAVSRIEELVEESVDCSLPAVRNRSQDVTVSTPLSRQAIHGIASGPVPSTNGASHISFHLSPLPDFTINENEASLQLGHGYVAKRGGYSSCKKTDNSFALATQELVKKITDVEPYEPYWEHIRQLDLKGRQLVTLHMLNQFCARLSELDVSDNDIGQLTGAPSSLRNLKIQRNCLSGLTAWNHLPNLQFLDISGNEVESLEGLRELVHLRELRADDNKITSLEGVLDLDGLVSLKVRRNLLVRVDFEATDMKRLTDLDLSGNKLSEVKNLQHVPRLEHLGLDDNEIQTLAVEKPFILPTLRSLRLTNNQLETLDVSAMPDLRVLYADRNKLNHVDGIQRAKYLDSVSMREQSPASNDEENSSTTEDCLEVRKLYISGNVYPAFTPKTDFLNLQYLELASSGVETLPQDIGQMMPNVRVLNLNFNALSDIRPLLGIRRLKKLLLAGNRLCRLRRTTAILSRFSSLARLDLRNNPLTVGFYPPTTENRLVVHEAQQNRNNEPFLVEPFVLPDANKEIDHAYSGRLDQGTKLRRRVYEMLLACSCERLRSLDGLNFDIEGLLSRDGVWEKLHDLGVVKDSATRIEGETETVEQGPREGAGHFKPTVGEEQVS
ncbi:MAG: hypothetical protein M1835_006182 [Candelina submexicana]|nr:MAG: hypothetical protein M1835_006182 [Candelina submexicana]